MINQSKKIIDDITTKEFIALIIRSCKGTLQPTRDEWASGYIDYALFHGLVEDYDMINVNNPIERRAAARIAHEVLFSEFGEVDEENWSAAENLKDLYLCHTCVRHIAQVYVKGIMVGDDHDLFHPTASLSPAEADTIITRICEKKERVPQPKSREVICVKLSHEEAAKLIEENKKAKLVDVRTYEEFKSGHIKGSISIPLSDIMKNPYLVNDNKSNPIILYCRRGYLSYIAAKILLNSDFSRIYTIPGIEEYQYDLKQVRGPEMDKKVSLDEIKII